MRIRFGFLNIFFFYKGDYIKGKDLKSVGIKILNQIVSGVAAMSHPIVDGEIVIHRDLKVDNILIQISPNGDPIVKIADFGCAIKIKEDKLADGPVGSLRES